MSALWVRVVRIDADAVPAYQRFGRVATDDPEDRGERVFLVPWVDELRPVADDEALLPRPGSRSSMGRRNSGAGGDTG
jgi:hypothetical protein